VDRRSFLGALSTLGAAGATLRFRALAEGAPLTVAAAGDCIITRRLSVLEEPRFLDVVRLFREADVGFGNCEMTLHDVEGYPAPTGPCGDLNLMAEPAIAGELAWAGLNLMALANNHAGDYGPEGLLATLNNLAQAGVTAAGAGANLAEARAPRFRDTPNGRVALVACASSTRQGTAASPSHAEIPGRPGLSPLRTRRIHRVPPGDLAALRRIQQSLQARADPHPKRIEFFGSTFEEASEPETVIEADPDDTAAILAEVRRARAEADLVIVSIHAHDAGSRREEPAAFLQPFARASIDAGADLFLGHGPHVLRALEIYRGKPIFYSLGNFLFQAETLRQIPAEIYRNCGISSLSPSDFFAKVMGRMFEEAVFWESVVPRVRYQAGRCLGIELHPVDLRWKLPPTRRGSPERATGEKAQSILQRLAELSRPYGTRIDIGDEVGSVVL
jgi:poly-gamma-glutamate capsule biosynthesis protein CapA/YwtB (metallophosphatase superfamily)